MADPVRGFGFLSNVVAGFVMDFQSGIRLMGNRCYPFQHFGENDSSPTINILARMIPVPQL